MRGPDPEDRSASDLAAVLGQIESSPDPQLALARLLAEKARATDPELADAIRYCAIPRRLDARIVGVLRGSDDEEANRRILRSLLGTGFLQPRKDGGHVYHDNVRDALIDEWRGEEMRDRFRELNDRLASFYDDEREAVLLMDRAWNQAADVVKLASEDRFVQLSGRIEGLALGPMIEALYHRSLASPETAFASLQDDLQRYEDRGRFAFCEALLDAASDNLRRQAMGADLEVYERWFGYWRARLAKAAGRYAEAEDALRQLLRDVEAESPVALAAPDPKLRLWVLDLLAGVLTEGHRYPEALRLYRQVLKLKESTGTDRWNLPVAYYNVAELYRKLRDYDRAETHFRAAIASAERVGHAPMGVSSRLGLAGMLSEAGDSAQAWELALDATIRARTTGLLGHPEVQREVAQAILGIGHASAPWLIDTVRAEFRGLLGALGSTLLLLSLESTYVEHLRRAGQLDRAAAALSDLWELAQIASSHRRAEIALLGGRLAQDRGSLDAAHDQYSEALKLARVKPRSDLLEVRALMSRARLAAIRGQWAAARTGLRDCAARAAAQGQPAIAADARLELASLNQRRGRLERAAELAGRVNVALEGSRSDQAARCHRVRGDIYRSAGRFAEAAEHYRRAVDGYLAFERHDEAALALSASATVSARLGRWKEAAERNAEATQLAGQLAAVADYRPSQEALDADAANAAGLGHLFTSGGTVEGEIRVARDWFLSAVQRLPERASQTAWYRLNLAFAHRLLHEQREAVEALQSVLAAQEGWTRSPALYRLFAEWGAEHGRALLREGEARLAERRFKSTIDVVRSHLPLDGVLGLACGHTDTLVASKRDDEAHAELQSVLEQATARGDARTQMSARVRLALAASTPADRRIEHLQRCLEIRPAAAGAAEADPLIEIVDELAALHLPGGAYRRLRDALSLTAAAVGDPADKAVLGRAALSLARRLPSPAGHPRQMASIVLEVDPALVDPDCAGSAVRQLADQQLQAAVARVAVDLGVPRAPATLRPDAGLRAGAYAIEIRQQMVARGRVRLDDRDAFGAILRHVEAALHDEAATFLDLEAVRDLLSEWRTSRQAKLPPSLEGPGGEVLLFRVLRRLLDEGVPIADRDAIIRGFKTTEPRPPDIQPVVERIRLALAPRIPGADGSREVVDAPRSFEAALGRHLQAADGKTFLALPPAQARNHRATVLRLLADRESRTTLLRVRNRSLRPFVRRFTERALPHLAVVSVAELNRALPEQAGST